MTTPKSNIVYRYASSIFLMLMLAWLTVSIPFVYAAQDIYHAKMIASGDVDANGDEDTQNPFANTTEEKTSDSNSTNFSEEYLHDSHADEHFQTDLSTEYKIEHVGVYVAFYGELLSPPPDHI